MRSGDIEGLVKKTNHLLHDTDRMAQAGSKCSAAREQEFSLEHMVASYEGLYTELASMPST